MRLFIRIIFWGLLSLILDDAIQPIPNGKREAINRNLATLNIKCYDVLLKQPVHQSLFERHVVIPFLVETGEAFWRWLRLPHHLHVNNWQV